MIEKIDINDILFLDIETVPEIQDFNLLDEETKELWAAKSLYQRKEEYTAEEFYDRAGIWAEFGKIVCISVGHFVQIEKGRKFRTTSLLGDEKIILANFKELMNNHFNKPQNLLCGHNSKEFDIPYIARRMIINGIKIPPKIDFFGKKPWEIPHLDTLELWKFGDFKHFTSLKLLTKILGIKSPKEDIDGSMVAKVFYIEKDIKRIAKYCENDVVAVAQVFLRLRGEKLLADEEIVRV